MSDAFIANLKRSARGPMVVDAAERAAIERGISRALDAPKRGRRMRWIAGGTAALLLAGLGAKYGPTLCEQAGQAAQQQATQMTYELNRSMEQAKRRMLPFTP